MADGWLSKSLQQHCNIILLVVDGMICGGLCCDGVQRLCSSIMRKVEGQHPFIALIELVLITLAGCRLGLLVGGVGICLCCQLEPTICSSWEGFWESNTHGIASCRLGHWIGTEGNCDPDKSRCSTGRLHPAWGILGADWGNVVCILGCSLGVGGICTPLKLRWTACVFGEARGTLDVCVPGKLHSAVGDSIGRLGWSFCGSSRIPVTWRVGSSVVTGRSPDQSVYPCISEGWMYRKWTKSAPTCLIYKCSQAWLGGRWWRDHLMPWPPFLGAWAFHLTLSSGTNQFAGCWLDWWCRTCIRHIIQFSYTVKNAHYANSRLFLSKLTTVCKSKFVVIWCHLWCV